MQRTASRQAGICVLRLVALRGEVANSGVVAGLKARWEGELKRRELASLMSKSVSDGTCFHDVCEVVDVPIWLFGNVFDAIGYNASQELIGKYPLHGARQTCYKAALTAEIARVGKDWRAASAMAVSALVVLPAEENLMRARMTLILALCRNADGLRVESEHYQEAACKMAPASPLWMGMPPPVDLQNVWPATDETIKRLKGEAD